MVIDASIYFRLSLEVHVEYLTSLCDELLND